MKAAILKALLLYVVGFSATVIIYFQADSHYAHGPNLYHLVFLFTIFLGFVWLLISMGQYYINPRKHLKGYMLVNGIAVLSFALFIGFLGYQNKKQHNSSVIDVEEIYVDKKGDTITMYYKANPIYYQIKDSVFYDFRNAEARKIDLK